MTKKERLMQLNGVTSMKKPDPIQEVNVKIDAIMTFMGVQGRWNGNVFQIVKQTMPKGDYTDPILYDVGATVGEGNFYYTETVGKDLPHQAIKSGVPSGFFDKEYFDWIE